VPRGHRRLITKGASMLRRMTMGGLVAAAVGALCVGIGPSATAARTNPAIVVNSSGDGSDDAIHDGTCDAEAADGAQCTLRAAIENANFRTGDDTITFRIGNGPKTIAPSSPLPEVSGVVVIDATAQPGTLPHKTCLVQTGHPCILLTGQNIINGGGSGLILSGGHSTVRGLAISDFPENGIVIEHAGSDVVVGNYIGTTITGTAEFGSRNDGILILLSTLNRIGGREPGEGNVISGNGLRGIPDKRGPIGFGVEIKGASANGNILLGNLIGTDVTGTAAIGNFAGGILVNGASDTRIGGAVAGAGNVISGNGSADSEGTEIGVGVEVFGTDAEHNRVAGNRIGVNVAGDALPNLGTGVVVTRGVAGGPSGNVVGGTSLSSANTIAFNHGPGVRVTGTASGDSVLRNAIHDNQGLGIDLGFNGVTANDADDSDTGANGLQNFPVLTSAVNGTTDTVVKGRLRSTPGTAFAVQLFVDDACDESGFGEGQLFLVQVTATTDETGLAKFTKSVSPVLGVGQRVTATATAPDGSTSEFSHCRTVTAG